MTPLSVRSYEFDGAAILFEVSHPLSPYVHATPIAKRYGKLVADFARLDETQAYLDALLEHYASTSAKTDLSVMGQAHSLEDISVITKETFIHAVQGGPAAHQGTWIHRDLSILFARWLNPKLAVWMDQIMLRQIMAVPDLVQAEQRSHRLTKLVQEKEAAQLHLRRINREMKEVLAEQQGQQRLFGVSQAADSAGKT